MRMLTKHQKRSGIITDLGEGGGHSLHTLSSYIPFSLFHIIAVAEDLLLIWYIVAEYLFPIWNNVAQDQHIL